MSIPSLDELNLLHSKICTAVGDQKRLQILYALYEEPQHVTALADSLGMPQSTVSRHLAILRERSLVRTERNGAAVIYSLTDTRIIDVMNTMREILRDTVERQQDTLS